jgi:AraC-like DNA-binding protein
VSAGPPQIVLDAEFKDMGRFGTALGWDLDFRQLEAGPLRARARAWAARRHVTIAVHFNRSFHQLGQAPKDLVCLGLPGSGLDEFSWCGTAVRGGSLINFNLASGFDSRTLRHFHGHVIAFERGRLQELAGAMRLDTPLDRLVGSGAAWRSPQSHDLGHRLERAMPLVSTVPSHAPDDGDFFDEGLGLAILAIVSGEERQAVDDDRTQHARILQRSLDILADSDQLPIGVAELCRRVGTSLSTLKRVFAARFDMTPKAYIRARCLSAVRDELALAPPGTPVADVANRWGFWHMGQFARDYRAMFGELPSETLKKAD